MKTILSTTHKGFTIIRTRDRNLVKGFALIKTPLRVSFVKANRGFTLIELLIVMAIIGVLATFVMLNIGNAQVKARDAERKSDLKQYQAALTEFAGENNGFYPSRSTTDVSLVTLCVTTLTNVSTCPEDPQTDGAYRYISNGTHGLPSATHYSIWTTLEVTEDMWQICSNGNAGDATVRPSPTEICTIGSTTTDD